MGKTAKKREKRRQRAAKRSYQRRQQAREASDLGGEIQVAGAEIAPFNVRRWDAAATDRLNRAHWQRAHGDSINNDLAADLETLRARANYEYANNPMVEGVVKTHALDVVGKDGPRLQVQSDDKAFNDAVEQGWQDIFEDPDPSNATHGVEMLMGWVTQLWLSGEYLCEEVRHERPDSATQLGIMSYHPRCLASPIQFASDEFVAFGIRFSQRRPNPPIQYYIEQTVDRGNNYPKPFDDYASVSADMIHHVFYGSEPSQIRGYPWLASALGVIADIREYDKHVMEAAKLHAARSVNHYADHPDAVWDDYSADRAGDTKKFEPGQEHWDAIGWRTEFAPPTHPHTEYVKYRHERLRELGRPVCMPLMAVLLSSAESNFASAHYDGQVYMRAIEWLQSLISRRSLTPYVKKMAREVTLVQRLNFPLKVNYSWTWPKPPYVNPKQMYDALRAQLEDGTATYQDVLSMYGRDEDSVIAARTRTNEKLDEADLPPLPANYGSGTDPRLAEQETEAKVEAAKKPAPQPGQPAKVPNGRATHIS